LAKNKNSGKIIDENDKLLYNLTKRRRYLMESHSLNLLYALILLLSIVVAWKVSSRNIVAAIVWIILFFTGAYVFSFILAGYGLGAGSDIGRQLYFGSLASQLVLLGLCIAKNEYLVNRRSLTEQRQ
jgi:hypothetical protein